MCNKFYSLRVANADDYEFVKNAKISNIFAYAKNISEEEKINIFNYVERYTTKFLKEFKIIVVNGDVCGCYLIRSYKDGVLLDEIFLLDKYRGLGIGTSIIENIIKNNKKIYLCVYKDNKKAIKLYKKLNFCIIEDADERFWMSNDDKNL